MIPSTVVGSLKPAKWVGSRKYATAAALCLWLGASTAAAQSYSDSVSASGPPLWTGGVFLGGNYFPEDAKLGNRYFEGQEGTPALLFGARIGGTLASWLDRESAPKLSVEVEAKLALPRTEMATGETEMAKVLAWRVHGMVEVMADRAVHPLFLVGVGAETLMDGPETINTPDTRLAGYAGLGAYVGVSDRGSLRADLRVELLAGRDNALASAAELHFGYEHRFGSASEAIGKKVLADERPEFIDDSEVLATELEPEPVDTDLDGIADADDRCPGEPEDKDDFQDDDGCPDQDDDGDGLLDAHDSCPRLAEDRNGFADQDGCPDELPQDLAAHVGVLADVGFDKATTRLRKKSRPTLERLAEVLARYADVRIEITAHTDASGKPDDDRELARRQAAYIKWFLVDKGVAEKRISVSGRGSDEMVGDRSTSAGRASNWRVVISLVVESAGDSSGSPSPVFSKPESTGEPAAEAPRPPKPSPVFTP